MGMSGDRARGVWPCIYHYWICFIRRRPNSEVGGWAADMEADTRVQPLNIRGFLFFALTGLGLLVLQTTVQTWIDPWGYGPDFCFLMVLYIGVNVPVMWGAVLASVLGYFRDAAGAGVFGMHAGLFLVAFVVVALVRKKLDPAAPWYQALFVLSFAIGTGAMTQLAYYFLNRPLRFEPANWFSPMILFLISSLVTAVIGPMFFWLLDQFRPRTAARSERE